MPDKNSSWFNLNVNSIDTANVADPSDCPDFLELLKNFFLSLQESSINIGTLLIKFSKERGCPPCEQLKSYLNELNNKNDNILCASVMFNDVENGDFFEQFITPGAVQSGNVGVPSVWIANYDQGEVKIVRILRNELEFEPGNQFPIINSLRTKLQEIFNNLDISWNDPMNDRPCEAPPAPSISMCSNKIYRSQSLNNASNILQ